MSAIVEIDGCDFLAFLTFFDVILLTTNFYHFSLTEVKVAEIFLIFKEFVFDGIYGDWVNYWGNYVYFSFRKLCTALTS